MTEQLQLIVECCKADEDRFFSIDYRVFQGADQWELTLFLAPKDRVQGKRVQKSGPARWVTVGSGSYDGLLIAGVDLIGRVSQA